MKTVNQKLSRPLSIAAFLLLGLVGCAQSEPPAATAPSPAATTAAAPSPSASAMATGSPAKAEKASEAKASGSSKAELLKLKEHLTMVSTAVNAGNFDQAKKEFTEFDEHWDKVEDKVKGESKQAYQNIEAGMDEVKNTVVRPAQPDKAKATAAIAALAKTLDTSAASLK